MTIILPPENTVKHSKIKRYTVIECKNCELNSISWLVLVTEYVHQDFLNSIDHDVTTV